LNQAGGRASTGYGRVLDVDPASLHEHVPAIMGSADDVKEAERCVIRADREREVERDDG
jgi:fructose-1,6-bisphosphatase